MSIKAIKNAEKFVSNFLHTLPNEFILGDPQSPRLKIKTREINHLLQFSKHITKIEETVGYKYLVGLTLKYLSEDEILQLNITNQTKPIKEEHKEPDSFYHTNNNELFMRNQIPEPSIDQPIFENLQRQPRPTSGSRGLDYSTTTNNVTIEWSVENYLDLLRGNRNNDNPFR